MIQLKITPPAIPFNLGPSIVARVRARFMQEAGALIVDSVRSILGHDAILNISDEWGLEKRVRKNSAGAGFKRVGGKDFKQPLIWTGTGIYDNLDVIAQGGLDGFIVMVSDNGGYDDGFDYAQYWEDATDYLGKGLDLVEGRLADLMADIIVQEMGL